MAKKRVIFISVASLIILLIFLSIGYLVGISQTKNKPVSPFVVLAANKGNKSLIYKKAGNKMVIAYRFQTLRPGFLKYVSLFFEGKASSVEIRKGRSKPVKTKKGLVARNFINRGKRRWVNIRFKKRPFIAADTNYWILINLNLTSKKNRTKLLKKIAFKVYTQRDVNVISLDKKATINYFPVESASLYYIYRSDNLRKNWKKIASTKQLGFTDKNLINGKNYFYSVTVKKGGVESEKSLPVSVIPGPKNIPSLQWKQPFYSNGFGEFPLFYKGDKFIGAGSNVYRFHADTGRLKKIYKLIDDKISLTENFNVPGAGIITKINRKESLIWATYFRYSTVNSNRESKTTITAMRLSDSKKIWSKTVKGSFISESLVASNGKVFMPTNNYGLYSFDIKNGKTKIIAKIHSASVPVIKRNYIYIGTSRKQKRSGLYKINIRTGNSTLAKIGENVTAGFSSPIFVNDSFIGKKIIFPTKIGRIFLIDSDSFKKDWSFTSSYGKLLESINGAGAYHRGKLYISILDSVYALDLTKNPSDKNFIIWEKKIENDGGPTYVSGAVTLTKNALYGRGAKMESIGRKTKQIIVFSLDPETGNEQWIMTFQGKGGFICSNPWPYGGLLNLDRAYTTDMQDPGNADYALKVSSNKKKVDLLEYRGDKSHHGYIDISL